MNFLYVFVEAMNFVTSLVRNNFLCFCWMWWTLFMVRNEVYEYYYACILLCMNAIMFW